MTATHTGHKSPNWLIGYVLGKAGVTINGPNPWDPQIHDPGVYSRIVRHGSLGLGEGYIAGEWHAEDVVAFLERLISSNSTLLLQVPETATYLWRTFAYNAQTRLGALKVIKDHYDLPLEFFQETLCPSLVYTSGHWGLAKNLADAQVEKIDMILKRADVQEGDRLLDIGGGFGGLARRAVSAFGARQVVLTTLSHVQADYVRNRYGDMPIEVRMCDYRDTTGPLPLSPAHRYDRITSVEMIEAVGRKNLRDYFATVHSLLKPDGVFALQAIVSRMSYGISNAYLEKYIFPGGYLPTEAEIVAKASPYFECIDSYAFRYHYAQTLAEWSKNLQRSRSKFDERFVRTQLFYFMMCEAAFRAGRIDVVQLTLKPRAAH